MFTLQLVHSVPSAPFMLPVVAHPVLCKSQAPMWIHTKSKTLAMGILKCYSLTSFFLEVGSLKGNDRQRWFAEKLIRYTEVQGN